MSICILLFVNNIKNWKDPNFSWLFAVFTCVATSTLHVHSLCRKKFFWLFFSFYHFVWISSECEGYRLKKFSEKFLDFQNHMWTYTWKEAAKKMYGKEISAQRLRPIEMQCMCRNVWRKISIVLNPFLCLNAQIFTVRAQM